MSKMKFTSGPWTAEITDTPYEDLGECWGVDSAEGPICLIDKSLDCEEANARLIASAPDLLRIAQAMLDYIQFVNKRIRETPDTEVLIPRVAPEDIGRYQQVIAMAKGESE